MQLSQPSPLSQLNQLAQFSQFVQLAQPPLPSQLSQPLQVSQVSQFSQVSQVSQISQVSLLSKIFQLSHVSQHAQVSAALARQTICSHPHDPSQKTMQSAPRGKVILSGVGRKVDFVVRFTTDGAGWAELARQEI